MIEANTILVRGSRRAEPHNNDAGLPPSQIPTVEATRDDVVKALRLVAQAYPDTELAMAVAEAMLIRLDTLREEAAIRTGFLYSQAKSGDWERAQHTFDGTREMLGRFNKRHTLNPVKRSQQ